MVCRPLDAWVRIVEQESKEAGDKTRPAAADGGWSTPSAARFARRQSTSTRRNWRAAISWAVAAPLFALLVWGLQATTGLGGLATGTGVALLSMWAFAIRTGRNLRRRLWAAVWGIALVALVWDGITFVRYVTTYNGDSTTQKMATWGRDHGLSPIIDYLEKSAYSKPPSRTPADELPIALPTTTSTTQPAAVDTTVETIATTTTIPQPAAPEPLATFFDPALPGEGAWQMVRQVQGQDAIWVTSWRPLVEYGSVVATAVVIDPANMRVSMFNGRETPGGRWVRDDHVPPELAPSLVAAMNGAFRLEHLYGGYMAEGKVVKPLENGRATIAISHDGKLTIGELGRDVFDDGSWQALRQNGILMVDGGLPQMERAKRERVSWGAAATGDLYVNRSAACELADGRIGYAMAGKVNPTQMADVLIQMGCVRAIQLDINNQWPNFSVFVTNLDGSIGGFAVDHRMNQDAMHYMKVSSKEFYAFFDRAAVPEQSILDSSVTLPD